MVGLINFLTGDASNFRKLVVYSCYQKSGGIVMSIQESDRTARNIELYPSVFGGPEEQQVAEALVQPPSTPPSYEKDYNSEPVAQPEAVEGELITQSQPGFAPKAPTRSKLGTAARLVKATTPVGAIAEGINAAAGPVARAAETRETRKLNKENRLAADPDAARENRKAEQSKTHRWIGGFLVVGMVAGGGVYFGTELIKVPERIINKGINALEHIFDKSHAPTADVIVQTAITHISLDNNLPLVDAPGTSSVVLKQHGTASFVGLPGNWHHATTQYSGDLQLSIQKSKDNIKYSSLKNQDGSYSLVATYNPQAIKLDTLNAMDDTVPNTGPSASDDPREGKASSELAQASFEAQCSPIISNLVPDGIAYEIKSSEINTEQQIEALPLPVKEKQDVVAALRKILAKPIIVHALIDSPNGPRSIPARSLNLVPIVNAKAKAVMESQIDPITKQHRQFLLTRDQVAGAIGLSKETSQLDLNATKECSLSTTAANDLVNIKGQKLVADEPAPLADSRP
jgi:hypothetical protein